MTASSESLSPAGQVAVPPAAVQSRRGMTRRGWLEAAAWLSGAVVLFACYLRLAGTRAVNSDGSAQALPAWDMLHGNLLLHGWQVVDVPFYTTELPEYMLVELVRGLNAGDVHVAAAITYTLVVVLAALLAKGRTTGTRALVRVLIAVGIMVAPQLVQGMNILISSPDHIGTSVPVLLAWLILDRCRPRWYVPVAVAVVLAWAGVADNLVLLIGVLPLALACAVQVIRAVAVEGQELRAQWYNLALGAGALVAAGASQLALHVIGAAGGFHFQPTGGRLITSAGALPQHLGIAGQGLLLLGGADFIGQPAGIAAAVMVLHLIGVALAGVGVLAAVMQFLPGRDLVNQVLVAGVAINLAFYVFSTLAVLIYYTREIAPVLPLSAVLAGRILADRIRVGRFARAALLVVLAGYLAGLGYELTTPPVPAQNQQIASWLETHHLRSGLSGYWQSTVVTLTTGYRVRVSPLSLEGTHVAPYYLAVKSSWYDPSQSSANFVVLGPTFQEYSGFTDAAAIRATFGKPGHIYQVGQYQVWVWTKNLLTDLRGLRPVVPR